VTGFAVTWPGLGGPAGAVVAVVGQPSQPPPAGPDDPGGRGADFGKSSPLGLLVLILFFVAVAFLVRSMTKHLKKVPESFDKPNGTSEQGSAGPA